MFFTWTIACGSVTSRVEAIDIDRLKPSFLLIAGII
jgi:hypothetical protein